MVPHTSLSADGGNWLEISKLVASDAGDRDWFGYSVSMSGEYAIVGAQGDFVDGNHSGSAYVFRREGSNWIEQTKLFQLILMSQIRLAGRFQ